MGVLLPNRFKQIRSGFAESRDNHLERLNRGVRVGIEAGREVGEYLGSETGEEAVNNP